MLGIRCCDQFWCFQVQCSVCRVFPNDDCVTACDTLCAQDELRCEDARCVANSARCDGVAVSPPSALPFIREVAGHAAVVLDGPARLETIWPQSADLTKPDLDVIPGDCRPRDAVVRWGVGAHFRYRRPPGRGWVDVDLESEGQTDNGGVTPKCAVYVAKYLIWQLVPPPPPPHPPCHPAPVTVNIHPNYSAISTSSPAIAARGMPWCVGEWGHLSATADRRDEDGWTPI